MKSLTDINADFPILIDHNSGNRLIYLDSANTSLTPDSVVKAMDEYYEAYNANIHRAVYPISEKATAKHEEARQKVAGFLNAKTSEIVFTRNASESLNLVVQTWGRKNLSKGDVVVLSQMEHHSNIVPWQILQKDIPFDIHYVGLTPEGSLDMEELQKVLDEKSVKMVSIVHESNALGTINPVEKIIERAHEAGAMVMIDASQSATHLRIDLQKMNPDFLVFTGHKLFGPTGIGVLYGKESLLEVMPPFLGGGEMIRTVTTAGSTWNDLPYKFEAGTPNIAGAIGLGAAIDFINEIGYEHITELRSVLTQKALEGFSKVKGLQLYGPQTSENRGAIFSFALEGVHPHDIATILGEKNICVRAGNHCAQPLMEYLGVSATTRMSLSIYNTEEDLREFFKALEEVKKMFGIS